MGWFSGGDDLKKREELGQQLHTHEKWCSRCYHMDGNKDDGFVCKERRAQTLYTGKDGYMIGNTREETQRPLCDGECFACWSLENAYDENYMVKY